MTITKKRIKAAAKRTLQRLAIARDRALVEAGQAAERRERGRAVQAGLKKAGKVALVAGAAVASVAAARALARRRAG